MPPGRGRSTPAPRSNVFSRPTRSSWCTAPTAKPNRTSYLALLPSTGARIFRRLSFLSTGVYMPETLLQVPPAPVTSLTEDEILFRDSVRQFADDKVRPLAKEMDE